MNDPAVWIGVPAALAAAVGLWRGIIKPGLVDLAHREAARPVIDALARAQPPILSRLEAIERRLDKIERKLP